MKKFILFVLLSVMVFSSCNTDKSEPVVKTTSELYVIGNTAGAVKSGIVRAAEQTDFIVFTGDDIVSFDVLGGQIWGQIHFTEEKLNEIISRVELYSELHFLIDDKPVFDPPLRIYRGFSLSFDDADFDMQFRYDGGNVFLTDVYMTLDSISLGEMEAQMEKLAANKQKRQQEFDVFIAYLKDAGKVVNELVFEQPAFEPAPSDSLCWFLFDKNVDMVKAYVDSYIKLGGLSKDINDLDIDFKINTLTSFLTSFPCIVDVKISEIEGSPSMCNVNISFISYNENGIIKDINFVVSFSDEVMNSTDVSLKGTTWKLVGIVDVKTDDLTELEPKDCVGCYTLSFDTDDTFRGLTTSNVIMGNYEIDYRIHTLRFSNTEGTEVGEVGDGYLYIQILWSLFVPKNQPFTVKNTFPKILYLYYNDGKNCLMYKEVKQ